MTYPLTSSIASSFVYLFASISRSNNTFSQQKKDNTNAQAKGNNAAEHIMVGSHIYRLLSGKYREGA